MRIKTAVGIITYSLLLFPTYLQANDKPLLTQVRQLYCADNETTAQQILEQLQQRHLSRQFHLPVEQNNQATNLATANLHAGSLDITLYTLAKTAEKYPNLRNLVERTVLKWNYCQVFENKKYYDLYNNQPRKLATYTPPLQWEGFRLLGFLDTDAHFIPQLLSKPPLGERAFEHFFHRIYREQCFPHPTTGELFHQQHKVFPQKLAVKKQTSNLHYPHQWETECVDKTHEKKVIEIESPPEPVEEKNTAEKTKPQKAPLQVSPPVKKTDPILDIPFIVEEQVTPEPTPPEPVIAETKPVEQQPAETKKTTKKKKPTINKEKIIPPKDFALPSIGIAPPAASSTPIATVISENPEETFGFTGNLYVKSKLSDANPSFGINASWKPIADSYWFIRGNIDYSYTIDEDPLSYSWGIGYDDWHEGTWSVQLNNWGPIKPGEGLALDKAIGNIGYKFKSETLAEYNLSANTSIDIPVDGEPGLNLGMQWNPKENWYIRTNIHQPFNGDDPTWSYGFGYNNWRVGKINVEYANYGSNPLFEDNFQENGILNVSYNWEF
jgi:outer membrane biosynthesis protein TonB